MPRTPASRAARRLPRPRPPPTGFAWRERFALEYALLHLARALPHAHAGAPRTGDIVRNVEVVQSPTVTVTPHATHRTTSAVVEVRLQPSPRHLLTVGAEGWQPVLDEAAASAGSPRRTASSASARCRIASRTRARACSAQDDWSPAARPRCAVTLGAHRLEPHAQRPHAEPGMGATVGGVPQAPVPGQVGAVERRRRARRVVGSSADCIACDATPGARVLVASAVPHAVAGGALPVPRSRQQPASWNPALALRTRTPR